MGSAESINPSPAPNNSDIITNFKREYYGALHDAKCSASLTETTAWQSLYADRAAAMRKARARQAARIVEIAERLKARNIDDDDEKGLKDAAKECASIRDADEAFERDPIARIKGPVDACETIVENYLAHARALEDSSPLHNVGVLELLRMEIAKTDRPVWNPETGVVSIEERW